mmetsp:Transcript_34144/g.72750  ORF Transcript_34144/g.72750 Transcript_34144/m.72750 type:complete len:117 (-) Transcript_34144:1264-1614(-)
MFVVNANPLIFYFTALERTFQHFSEEFAGVEEPATSANSFKQYQGETRQHAAVRLAEHTLRFVVTARSNAYQNGLLPPSKCYLPLSQIKYKEHAQTKIVTNSSHSRRGSRVAPLRR